MDKPYSGSQLLIFSTVYPFKIDSLLIKILLFSNHMISLMHTPIVLNFDGTIVFLIFICTHRLKVLENNFKNATNFADLTHCIREHVDIL